MKYLSLKIPGGLEIKSPSSIPQVKSGQSGLDFVGGVFRNGLTLLLILTISLSLIFIVVSGIQWITSGGDKTKLQAARARLTWAVIGLIVAFLAFFIVSGLGYLFGVDLLSFS